MTIGEIRLQITTAFPGVNLDLLDNWIVAAYNAVLDRLNWQHNDAEFVLTTAPEVNAGTVQVTQGSDTVVGTGTGWTSAIDGCIFRVTNDLEYYGVAFVDATHLALDRVYLNGNATAQGYRINQTIYQLPAEARVIQQLVRQEYPGEVDRSTAQEINREDASRTVYSDVQSKWAPYMDAQTTPPLPQIELWPVSILARAMTVMYTIDNHLAAPLSAATALLAWVNPQAVIQLVRADVLDSMKDYMGSSAAKANANGYIDNMLLREASQQGPVQLRGDARFARRNQDRSLTDRRRANYGRIYGA